MNMNKKIIKFVGILISAIVIINFCAIISNATVITDGVGTSAIKKFEDGAKVKYTDKNNKSISTTQNILVEGKSKNNEDMLTGRTATGKIVIFKGENDLIGQNVNIHITESHAWYLVGDVKI